MSSAAVRNVAAAVRAIGDSGPGEASAIQNLMSLDANIKGQGIAVLRRFSYVKLAEVGSTFTQAARNGQDGMIAAAELSYMAADNMLKKFVTLKDALDKNLGTESDNITLPSPILLNWHI